MSLASGSRLGVYEITALIGEGGMGQVYRARDSRLDRDVAIKVLPPEFTADPDRVARFEREAKTLASLNHQSIGGIYGLEDADGVKALVLELIEGPTLADRIAPGPLPVDEALAIAKQIGDALEAAHEQGIIHRDLKPANIKVRPDGTVKVLDFGLAKAAEPAAGIASRMSLSPTLSLPGTYAGVILGTAAYMSPEQARGRAVDRRTDIWAFGCVLFEMLSGKRPFDGDDLAETLGAVIHKDVAWDRLPDTTPPTVRRVLERCLQKDPKARFRDIGYVQLALSGAFDAATASAEPSAVVAAPRPLWKRAIPGVAAALAGGAAVAVAAWTLRPPAPVRPPVMRFTVTLGEGQQYTVINNQMMAVSPDGTLIAYVADNRLYLRAISEATTKPIPGTEQVPTPFSPVFSPDGKWIAYASQPDETIKKASVNGGAQVTLCKADRAGLGRITWDDEGIMFGQPAGIMRVAANGGQPQLLIKIEDSEFVHGPQALPGGEWVLFTLTTGPNRNEGVWDTAQIVVQSLKTSERKTLITGASDGRYLPSGHLVYAIGGVVFAVPFDLKQLAVTGDRVPVVEGVRRTVSGLTAATQFGVSDNGVLVFVPGPVSTASVNRSIATIDRDGKIDPLKLPSGNYATPRVSPDGKQLAFATADGGIYIYDLSGTSAMRRLTLSARNRVPIWSPDSQYVAYQSNRDGDEALYRHRADGTAQPERLTKPEPNEVHTPESWSRDGRTILYGVSRAGTYRLDALSLADGKTVAVPGTESAFPTAAAFSPDGKWVAYSVGPRNAVSSALYVQPFPPTGATFRISPSSVYTPRGRPTAKS